jgi:hypothetical protein
VRAWTPTVRLWVSSLCWSVVLLLACLAIQLIEAHGLGLPPQRRLVRHAPEFAVRVVGLSHFVVALFFLLTGSRVRDRAVRVRVAALAMLGGGLSAAFATLGGPANPLCLAGLNVIFMAHAFRDEAFFYRRQAAAGATPLSEASLLWVQTMAVGVLGMIIVPTSVYVARVRGEPGAAAWLALLPGPSSAAETFIVFGLPFALVAAVAAVRVAAAGRSPWRTHAPLLKVLSLSIALVVVSSALVGAVALRLVILMHFVGWFRFTTARLRDAEPATPAAGTRASLTAWLRGNVHGFWLLHGGSAAIFLAIIASNHYLVGAAPLHWYGGLGPDPVTLLFGAGAFYYWTIAHLALSAPLGVGHGRTR